MSRTSRPPSLVVEQTPTRRCFDEALRDSPPQRVGSPPSAPPAGGYAPGALGPRLVGFMRRGLVLTIVAVAALTGLPAAAAADAGAPIVYFGFDDGVTYPQGYDISLGFFCASETSAIVSCEGSQPLGSKLDTVHAGPHTVTVTANDYEGRQTVATQSYTV